VLRAVHELPYPSPSAVDDLEAAIAGARLPVSDRGAFDRAEPRMTDLLGTNAISDRLRASPKIETWMAGLDDEDRVVTCTIVRSFSGLPNCRRVGGVLS
jgi:hypothetical protein